MLFCFSLIFLVDNEVLQSTKHVCDARAGDIISIGFLRDCVLSPKACSLVCMPKCIACLFACFFVFFVIRNLKLFVRISIFFGVRTGVQIVMQQKNRGPWWKVHAYVVCSGLHAVPAASIHGAQSNLKAAYVYVFALLRYRRNCGQ